MQSKGSLYVIAVPIGNLKDITLRALEILKELDILICEDTRSTQKLLNYYDLGKKKLISFYKDVEKEKLGKILDILRSGKDLGLLSEAGTPIISDPGSILVKSCHEEGIKVIPIPGVSALTTALSASGIDASSGFVFGGFPPRKNKEKKAFFQRLNAGLPIVIFESPHRVHSTLRCALEVLGNCRCFLARELTKLHEELLWTDIESLLTRKEFKGELTLIFIPEKTQSVSENENKFLLAESIFKELRECNVSSKKLIKALANSLGLPTKELYQRLVNLKD